MERPIAAPLLPILRDSDTFNDLERPVKRTKFHKQSTSFAALDEDKDVLRHGIKPFLKLKHPHVVYHADFNKYTETYLLLDTTSVHFWSKTGQYIKSCKIDTFFTKFISVPQNDCLIGWSPGTENLKILSPDFKFIGSVESVNKVFSVVYNESTDELLTGGQGNFTVWSFRKLQSQKLVRKTVVVEGLNPMDELQQLMMEDVIGPAQRCFAASSRRVYIFDIYGGKVLMCLDNLHKHTMSSCVFVSNLTLLISASNSGSIKVWDDKWQLKHVFVGHSAKVTELIYYDPDNCIISASVDKTIRLWSLVFLDQMQCIQTWSMTLGLGVLPDNSTLYSYSDQGVEVWELSCLHTLLTTMSKPIQSITNTTSVLVPTRILVTIGEQMSVISPLSGEVLEVVHLPDPNLHMRALVYVPSEGFMYCLDDGGDIYVYTTAGNPCKLICVWKGKDLGCYSSCLTNYEYLVDAIPYSEGDLDSLQVGIREDISMKALMIQSGGQVNQNILMAGCHDGSLVMFNRRYGRVDFKIQGHESEVVHLVSNTTASRVISAATDHVIRVWRMYPFAEEALAPMFSYYTVQAPKHLITGLGRLFYSYEKADTCTFIVVMHDLIDKKHRYPHNPDHDHTGSITSIAVCEQQQTFLSASIDTSIKVWDLNNQLVRTVILNTIPTGLAFGNNKGDLLLTVKNEIRKINHRDYLPADYLRHMIGVQFPLEISERPVPKSRGAKETMSDLESTLPSGIRQNRDQLGYVPLAQLRERCKLETVKKAEIAKLQQRNYELEMLSQGKYEGRKCIRKSDAQTAPALSKQITRQSFTKQTKKMRDLSFENYFKLVYPSKHKISLIDDDEQFEKGSFVGPLYTGRRDSLAPTPVPYELIDPILMQTRGPLPVAPDGYKPNSCLRRQLRPPTPEKKGKKEKKKEWKLKRLTQSQLAELAAHMGSEQEIIPEPDDDYEIDYEMLEGRDWASETSDSMSSSDFTDAIEEEDEEEEEEDPTPPPPPRPRSKAPSRMRRSKTLVKEEEEDEEEYEASSYMNKLQDIMAHVKPPTPASPTPEPASSVDERTPSPRKPQVMKPIKKLVSRPQPAPIVRPVTRKAVTPPPPPPPLPNFVVMFQDEPWFRAYLPSPDPATFPETNLSQFVNMMLDAMRKAAFHVKAEVCQALVLIHTQFSIPTPTDVKLALLQLLNEDPLPRLVLPDEKQFVIDALKLLRKMNIMDESVLMELMAQFIDGDDSVRSLVQAILIARGLLNHNNYVEVELDGWETWKLEGDPKRKAKLLVMANDWMTDWKAKYNEFISHISDEAKKTGKTVSEIMGMLSAPGTSPTISIINFFVYKCKEKDDAALNVETETKKGRSAVRNAVISMPGIRKSNLMRLGESHRSRCHSERESTLTRFLPPLDSRQQSRLNVLMDGFTTYIHLALKPISVSPFSVPDSKKALREKTRPKSLNLLSPFRYFLPDMSSLAIADKPIS